MIARRGILGLILAAPAAAKTVLEEAAGNGIAGNVGSGRRIPPAPVLEPDADTTWNDHWSIVNRVRDAAGMSERFFDPSDRYDHMKSWSVAYRRSIILQEERRKQKIQRRIDGIMRDDCHPIERGMKLMELAREFGV